MATTRDYIDYLNSRIGIAPADSQEELQAAALLKELMDQHGLNAGIQEFDAPRAGEMPYSVLYALLFVGVILAGFGGTVAGSIGGGITFICSALFLLRRFGYDFLSGLAGVARSQNVVGVHRAEGPLVMKGNRPIVIVAHYDTPRVSLLRSSTVARYLPALCTIAPICLGVACVGGLMQLLGFLPAGFRGFVWVVSILAALPLLVLAVEAIYQCFSAYTEGANDNKASLAAMLGVLDKVRPASDAATGRARVAQEAELVDDEGEKERDEQLAHDDADLFDADFDEIPEDKDAQADKVAEDKAAKPDKIKDDFDAPFTFERGAAPIAFTQDESAAKEEAAASSAVALPDQAQLIGDSKKDVIPPQVVTETYEEVVGVRHGAEVIESLHMLPETCEIVYAEPRLLDKTVHPKDDLDSLEGDAIQAVARIEVSDSDQDATHRVRRRKHSGGDHEHRSHEHHDPYDGHDESADASSSPVKSMLDKIGTSIKNAMAKIAEHFATTRSRLLGDGAIDEDMRDAFFDNGGKNGENPSVRVVGSHSSQGDDSGSDKKGKGFDGGVTLANDLKFEEEYIPTDEEIDRMDVTGLTEIVDDQSVNEPHAIVPAPKAEGINEPGWGTSDYRPSAEGVARRANLFDLPDPSASVVDPLDSLSSAPRPVPSAFIFSDDDENGGSWKGGATTRSGLREGDDVEAERVESVEDLSQIEGHELEDELREELRDAVLGMGDDELLAHDIWFVGLGGSGLDHAGMKAFLRENRSKIRGAFLVNLTCVGAGKLTLLTSEGLTNGRKTDRRVMRLVTGIADDLHVAVTRAPHAWGDTDATPAMRKSVRSLTIMGAEDGVEALSHTLEDTPDHVNARQVSDVSAMVTELIRRS